MCLMNYSLLWSVVKICNRHSKRVHKVIMPYIWKRQHLFLQCREVACVKNLLLHIISVGLSSTVFLLVRCPNRAISNSNVLKYLLPQVTTLIGFNIQDFAFKCTHEFSNML